MSEWTTIGIVLGGVIILQTVEWRQKNERSPLKEFNSLRNALFFVGLLLIYLPIFHPSFIHYIPKLEGDADIRQIQLVVEAQGEAIEDWAKETREYWDMIPVISFAIVIVLFPAVFKFARAIAKLPPYEDEPPTIRLDLNDDE